MSTEARGWLQLESAHGSASVGDAAKICAWVGGYVLRVDLLPPFFGLFCLWFFIFYFIFSFITLLYRRFYPGEVFWYKVNG